MTDPTWRDWQVDLVATSCAICMKYSSQVGLVFLSMFSAFVAFDANILIPTNFFNQSCPDSVTMLQRAQAATEYLVILGAVLLVAAITVSVLALNADTSSAQVQESAIYWSSTYPFIITSAKAVGPALVLTLRNTADEPLWLTGIRVDGTQLLLYDYSGDVFGASRCPTGLDSCSIQVEIGQSVIVVARGLSECLGRSFLLDRVQFDYSNLDLTGLLQVGDKPLAGYCSQKVNGVNYAPPTPANDSWFSTGSNITINSTIQGMALTGLNFTWNESTTRVYDDSLVLAMNFDDSAAIGDTAGNVVDVSQYGNNGTIYGNTALLLHFDENDGYRAYDESRFANNATVYGNTEVLLSMDEGSGNKVYDSSIYRKNGTCYNMGGGSGVTNCNWVSGKNGYGVQLGGTDDYIGIPYGTAFNSTTVSIWFKGAGNTLISSLYWFGSGHTGYILTPGNSTRLDGVLYYQPYGYYAGLTVNAPAGVNFSDGITWHHAVLTFNSTGMALYLDGVLGNVTMRSITLFAPENNPDTDIGRYTLQNNDYFTGYVDEVSIYSRTLNTTEVSDLYNAGRAKFAEWTTGKSGSALQFDGYNDYATFPAINLNTYYSIEVWLWPGANNGADWAAVLSNVNTVPEFGFSPTRQIQLYSRVVGPVLPQYEWSHVVVTRNGNNHSIYVNGVMSNTASVSAPPDVYGVIGAYMPTASSIMDREPWSGMIDELALYQRSLTGAEVAQHYAASRAKHAEWDPNGKYGNAMKFDGLNDYVRLGSSTSMNISNNFTISAWVNVKTVTGGSGTIYNDFYWGGTGYFGINFFVDSGSQICGQVGNGVAFTGWQYSSLGAYQRNVWYYLTMVKADTNLSFYSNGQLANYSILSFQSVNSYPGSVSYLGSNIPQNGQTLPLNGSIDEVRIWNRSLSAEEIKQQYYSSLNKYAPDKWIFAATEQSVPAGTYGYSLTATGNATTDFTANRSVRVS